MSTSSILLSKPSARACLSLLEYWKEQNGKLARDEFLALHELINALKKQDGTKNMKRKVEMDFVQKRLKEFHTP